MLIFSRCLLIILAFFEGSVDRDFLKNIAALFKVKTIVTLVVVAVFAALALREKLQPDTVMTIVTMVVAFYFGTQTESKNKKDE